MDSRRKGNIPANNNDFAIIKTWKESGPEQRELEKLFEKKIIDESDSPNEIRLKNPMFRGFSQRVFNAHFRKTKAKLGFCGSYFLNEYFKNYDLN